MTGRKSIKDREQLSVIPETKNIDELIDALYRLVDGRRSLAFCYINNNSLDR